MLAKTGLLIVSNPQHIGKLLSSVQSKVKNTLYIQILSALSDPFGSFHPNLYNTWPKYSQTISGIYTQAATHCKNLDVRVLLSGLKYKELQKIQTNRRIDVVIFDKIYNRNDVDKFLQGKIENRKEKCEVLVLDINSEDDIESVGNVGQDLVFSHAVLGGTFDRLHIAHKLMLSEAALRSKNKVTVGVTEESMLKSKLLWELIEPTEKRMENVREFLFDVCRELEIKVVPIDDVYGPTKDDPTMDLLVVSAETIGGGKKVNEVRHSKGLSPLEVFAVQLIDEPFPEPNEEVKISSSTGRLRLLGTVLGPIEKNDLIPRKPYVIGLTGSICSGKSGVAERLSYHGAKVIDCDKIGHNVYRAGKPCFATLVDAFGDSIVGKDGEIDRRTLGQIVFSNPEKLEQLNSLVWPAIANEVNSIIRSSTNDVVVVEAAILLKAGWEKYCHEVWTTIVPENEAIKRLQVRNNLSEEEALKRIRSQASNSSYVQGANIVFCPFWEKEYTYRQVDKAWVELQKRISA